jgi:phenylacetic acid degradation operon negative regulatory protein
MLHDEILSAVRGRRPSQFVFSLLASYGERRGGALPGTWFVEMLNPLGVSADAVRQTLFRMTRARELDSVRSGRRTLYRLTALARVGTDAGTRRLLTPPRSEWDGRWYLVNYSFRDAERAYRDLVGGLLEIEGFARLSRGTFIHPRDRTSSLVRSLEKAGLIDRVQVFRAERVAGETDRSLVRHYWDLEALSTGYRRFIRLFSPLARRGWSRHRAEEALIARFAFVLTYLETAWRDPELPERLLPADWPARRAQHLARRLYDALDGQLLALGDHVLRRCGLVPQPTPSTLSA